MASMNEYVNMFSTGAARGKKHGIGKGRRKAAPKRSRLSNTRETAASASVLNAPTTVTTSVRVSDPNRSSQDSAYANVPLPVSQPPRRMSSDDLAVHQPGWDVLVSDSATNPNVAGRMVAKLPTPADFRRYEALSLTDKISELNVATMKVASVLATLPSGIASVAHNEHAALERAEAAALARAKAEADLEVVREELEEKKKALAVSEAREIKYRREKARLESEIARVAELAEVRRANAFEEGKSLGVESFKVSEDFKKTLRQEGYFAGRGAFKMCRRALIEAGQDPSILDNLCSVLVGKDDVEESKEEIYDELARAEEAIKRSNEERRSEEEEDSEADFEGYPEEEAPPSVDLTVPAFDEDLPRADPMVPDSPHRPADLGTASPSPPPAHEEARAEDL